MAIDRISLPKDPKILADVMRVHANREEQILLFRRTMWLVAYYYLNGARTFTEFNPVLQSVRPLWVDADGNAEFQSSFLLKAINDVIGRFMAFDLRPKVTAQGTSLDSHRSRAVGQVILDSGVSDDQVTQVTREFAATFATLGICGIVGHIIDHPTVGLVSDLEVVHPSELMPFPTCHTNLHKQRGLMRQRYVPMQVLYDVFGKKKIKKNLDCLEWFHRPVGEAIESDGGGSPFPMRINNNKGIEGDPISGESQDVDRDDMTAIVKLRELWTWGPRQMVDRYAVNSGECILDDISYEREEMYCPLGVARFMETGSFYGAGMFDLLFSLSRQNELLLKSLFNNVRDMDRYGVIVIPQGEMNEKPLLRDVGRGLKYLPWAPDPLNEKFQPFTIQPATTGDFPGKVSTMAQNLLNSLSPIGDLAAEKGRVDSAQGLSFLDEKLNQAMTTPSGGIQQAFSLAYRGVGTAMTKALAFSPKPVPVGRLTLDLAGVVLDPEQSTISFPANPLPDLSRLSFTVREVNPKSEAARKGEALELFKEQVQDRDSLVIFSLQEGLDLAMWHEEEKGAYESIVRDCLILFGDGKQPGEITPTPYTTKPDLQLRVLSGFMCRPLFRLASVEIHDAFAQYRDTLMSFSGQVLPAAVPNPDDAAMLQAQMLGQLNASTPMQLTGASQ